MDCSNSTELRRALLDDAQQERRTEVRYPASGRVILHLYEELGVPPATVEGELVDRSAGGCKVRHQFGHLKPGQQVTLLIDECERGAIVVWTRSVSEYYESGFSFVR